MKKLTNKIHSPIDESKKKIMKQISSKGHYFALNSFFFLFYRILSKNL